MKIERRSADEGEIRDGFLLAEPGSLENLSQAMGPNGFMYAQWRDHVQHPLSSDTYLTNYIGTIPIYTREALGEVILAEHSPRSPVKVADCALKDVMTILPKEEMVALQWADISLSNALGWKHMTP